MMPSCVRAITIQPSILTQRMTKADAIQKDRVSLAIFHRSFPLYSLRIWNCYIKEVSGYLEFTTEIFPEFLNLYIPVNYSFPKLTFAVVDAADFDQHQHKDFSDTNQPQNKTQTGTCKLISKIFPFIICVLQREKSPPLSQFQFNAYLFILQHLKLNSIKNY